MLGRTLTSRKKRAETKALHRVLSSPLMHNPPDVNNPEDNEDIEDDLDEDDPEVHISLSFHFCGYPDCPC